MARRFKAVTLPGPFGIPIRLDPSWFVIFAVYVWVFGSSYLPRAAPDLGRGEAYLLAVAVTLLFFLSVLAHEMAHSLAARREGIGIHNITLYVFGGMAHLDREPDSPGAEFKVAAAGPAASLAAGGLFLIGEACASRLLSPTTPWGPILHHLGWLNVFLAGFNLLPGFPLDGGRMLRAVLWARTGSYHRATRQSATSGKWIAYALVALGFPAFFWDSRIGLSCAVLGLLLISLLHRSLPSQPLQPTTDSLPPTAVDVIDGDQIFVSPLETVAEAKRKIGALPTVPVVHLGRLYGFLQLRRLDGMAEHHQAAQLVRDAMDPVTPDHFIDRRLPLDEVERFLRANGLGAAAILDGDGTFLGCIRLSDLNRFR